MPFDTFPNTHPPVDAELVNRIVSKLKSQGIFDQFRKDCLADVDTKPAYQNLHSRVNVTVASFLATQKWQPDLNKTQLRESLRRHVQQGFLEVGVDRIVDQVVNPKIVPLFMPKVEDVVYDCLGIEKPKLTLSAALSTQFLTSFPPPLPRPSTPPKAVIPDLLPKDLDPVSPESGSVCMNGGDTPLKDEINNTNTSTKFEEDQDSQLSGISELSSHMGDSIREIPEPVDSNTVRSISSIKSDTKDLQFDNFTNLSEKIKQAEKSHGQVSGVQSDKIDSEIPNKSVNDISLPEELTGSSPKYIRDEQVSEEIKFESTSNNTSSTFEDSKTFTSSKLFKDDTLMSFSDDSVPLSVNNKDKEENSVSKTLQNSQNSNGNLLIERTDNSLSKIIEEPDRSLPKINDQADNSFPKITEHPDNSSPKLTHHPDNSLPKLTDPPDNTFPKLTDPPDNTLPKLTDPPDNTLPKLTDHPVNLLMKEPMNDSKEPESMDEQKDESISIKLDDTSLIKKDEEKTKDKKSRDSSVCSKYSRSSDKSRHSDFKQRSHDKKLKCGERSTERDRSSNREDKEEKSRKDDKNRSSYKDDKSLQKQEKDTYFHKNEKESTSNKEYKDASKKESRDKAYSRDKEKSSNKEDSCKSYREDKIKYNDERRKNIDKDKRSDRSKDKERESRKESKSESKDNTDKEKKGNNASNREKEQSIRNKDGDDKEKEEGSKSKREPDKNRPDIMNKDRGNKNNEKDADKYLKDKNRSDRDKQEKDRGGKQSKEKNNTYDDKSRDSKKKSYDKFNHSTSSGKKMDNTKADDLDKKSKADENSRNKSTSEKNKIEDKKDRKRKGERCNDEVKSKDGRRSSDRDSNGSKGGSGHRANFESKPNSSHNSKHSNSEKKSRGSTTNGTNGSQDQTDNTSQPVGMDSNDTKEESLNHSSFETSKSLIHASNDSSKPPSEVDLILSKLNSSIEEIENSQCNPEPEIKEAPVKKPKIAKNFAEIRKIMLVRKNMERKYKNEVNSRKDANELGSYKTEESHSSTANITEIPEENKENIKSGFEKTNVLKNNVKSKEEFHGFSDKDIEIVLNHFLTFENVFGTVKYKRLFDFTEHFVSHYKQVTVGNGEELFDNNLNKLIPKTLSFSEVAATESNRLERSVSDNNQCRILLQQDCPELSKHLKSGTRKEESPLVQCRMESKGRNRNSQIRSECVEAIRAYDEVRTEGSVMPANDEPSEAGPVGQAVTPDEIHDQQANIGQQPDPKEPLTFNLGEKIEQCSPESPNPEPLSPESPESISDDDKGLSMSLTEDMLNNLMKESMVGMGGVDDCGDPYDSECEGCPESAEIVFNHNVVKENSRVDVRENLVPEMVRYKAGENSVETHITHDPVVHERKKRQEGEKKQQNKRQPRASQRYGSSDLYKPRPVFRKKSKRIGASNCVTSEEETMRPKRDQSEPPIKRTAR